ncbi:hypothetical protein CFII64_24129 [Pseudomonas sp. CFII64]|nr:hypothetical protein CFII64_24129 [Pseudomonas sp. CFII64]
MYSSRVVTNKWSRVFALSWLGKQIVSNRQANIRPDLIVNQFIDGNFYTI